VDPVATNERSARGLARCGAFYSRSAFSCASATGVQAGRGVTWTCWAVTCLAGNYSWLALGGIHFAAWRSLGRNPRVQESRVGNFISSMGHFLRDWESAPLCYRLMIDMGKSMSIICVFFLFVMQSVAAGEKRSNVLVCPTTHGSAANTRTRQECGSIFNHHHQPGH